jgi:3-polyprenyl-4-hydroxybenzoate decarboxylase
MARRPTCRLPFVVGDKIKEGPLGEWTGYYASGIEIPYGKNELDAAGGILGEPIEVITLRNTTNCPPSSTKSRLWIPKSTCR